MKSLLKNKLHVNIFLIFILTILTSNWHNAYCQTEFEVLIEDSGSYTNITTDMGRQLKFLATKNRLVVLDYENYRILFYEKGNNFEDNQILRIVGEHSRAQVDKPFDPVNNNRLSSEFTGTIFKDTLWITNYHYGEILLFDLDGNYIKTISDSKFRYFDINDSTLYAFYGQKVYKYDESNNTFIELKNLPNSACIGAEICGSNVKIGFDRLCSKQGSVIYVYDFSDFIENETVSAIFSISARSSYYKNFELMPDKILWSTDDYGNYQYCNLNGSDSTSGDFSMYIFSYHYTYDTLYIVGSYWLKMYDIELTELVSSERSHFYLQEIFFGGDFLNLYFYDGRDGGFVIAPLDTNEGVFKYNPNREISYSGCNRIFRKTDDYCFLLSGFSSYPFKIYRFDIDSMSSLSFGVDEIQGFDVAEDTIYTLFGKNLKTYSTDGILLQNDTLSNLSESNLENIDSTTQLLFAANDNHLFIVYSNKLNILSHNGVFEKIYDFETSSYAQIFASNSHVFCNNPLNSLEISTGNVETYLEVTPTGGFIYKDRYWYSSGINKYAYKTPFLTNIYTRTGNTVTQFILSQNYPNPFNPTTKIRYELPKRTRVTIEIYNLLGQKVATLLEDIRPAGSHIVNFNGSGLSSGVYFYRFQADNFIQTKRFILLK